MKIKELIDQYRYHIVIAAAYVAALLYLLFGVGMGCYHVTQHPAFLTDSEFLMEWLPQPGGLGAYLSLFVEQFFYMPFWGGFFLILEILLAAWLLVKLMERIFDKKFGAKSLLWIAPLFVAMLCLNNVYFDFSLITRLLLMLAVMNLLHLLPEGSKFLGVLSAVSAVAIYHFCGPMYLYSFCAAELVLAILGKIRFVDYVWTLGMTVVYPVLMFRFVMPLSPSQVFYNPVTMRSVVEQYQTVIYLFFFLVPVTLMVQHFANKHDCSPKELTSGKKQKKSFCRRSVCYAAVVAAMAVVVAIAFRISSSRTERFSALMAWKAEQSEWTYIIDHARDLDVYDRNTNFYYDLALAMTGQMSQKLFDYPQSLGNQGLLIEHPMAGSVCFPTSTMYFMVGQISAALHYAHESHIYYPHSPYVMRRIIDCLVISGRYDEAEMFLKQFDRNMLSHRFVRSRRRYMAGQYTRLLPVEFVQGKQNTAVKEDYIMAPPYRNFEQLFIANQNNQPALDYLLCYLLLDKDLNNFFNVLEVSGYDKNNLPKLYQEAVAIYMATTQHPRKYATEVKVAPNVSRRFTEFGNIVNKMGKNAYNTLKQSFADTYWIYYTFEKNNSPQK